MLNIIITAGAAQCSGRDRGLRIAFAVRDQPKTQVDRPGPKTDWGGGKT